MFGRSVLYNDLLFFFVNYQMIKSIEWLGDAVRFLDQTELPLNEKYVETKNLAELEDAIVKLKIRGAPLLGIAAAYGVLLGIQPFQFSENEEFLQALERSIFSISKTRPTAKNLFWALERMKNVVRLNHQDSVTMLFEKLTMEAIAIHNEDRIMCESIGKNGANLIGSSAKILTHCNTGALATGGIGTAQGIITTAHRQGKKISVYADETRPLLQGARLTAWELMSEGVDVTLITDNMAAWTIKSKKIDLIITGADRIAANGDTANKIGTYNLAILAKEHGIPFYIAAPTTTIDIELADGNQIPIEERSAIEVVEVSGKRIAPENVNIFSPSFDVTPNELITAIITEKEILYPPFFNSIKKVLA